MFAVVYRWRVIPGLEDQFVRSWSEVTAAIRTSCGSYGSRLHRCADGSWLGYARWPDAQTRKSCEHGATAALRRMQEATEAFEEWPAEIVMDLLAEPPADARDD